MKKDKNAIRLYVEQQQIFHDELYQSYLANSSRIITYIGGTLALLVFLYAGALDESKTTLERLFIPATLYGKIFYVFGLLLILYALFRLVKGMRPDGVWTVAFQSKDVEIIEGLTEEQYLVKLKMTKTTRGVTTCINIIKNMMH